MLLKIITCVQKSEQYIRELINTGASIQPLVNGSESSHVPKLTILMSKHGVHCHFVNEKIHMEYSEGPELNKMVSGG